MDSRLTRTAILIGDDAVANLSSKSVLVVGVGGVGGYAVEMLARTGVGNITLCDGDIVDVTNINRQIIALNSTLGRYKCDCYRDRINDINAEIIVKTLNFRYNTDTFEDILSGGYDYIIDAIDSVPDKVHLIIEAHKRSINIVSAMGAGNRYKASDYEVCDIYKTSYDPFAKKIRKLLRDASISSHNVVYTKSEALARGGAIGSISYMPALAGVKLGAFVLGELTGEIPKN